MPCPYAEKKGPVVYCRLVGKKVNPLAFPCLTNRYEKCKYYRAHARKEETPPPAASGEVKPLEKPTSPTPRSPEPVRPVARVEPGRPRARGETKGLTLDGRRPATCLECIYYGAKTRTCLLLGVTVEDPNDPPCAKM